MRFEKRLRALEARFISDPVVLIFADGRKQEIHGSRYFLLDLIVGASRGDLSPTQAAQLELIRRSVYAEEPGHARLTELIRIMPNGPEELHQNDVLGSPGQNNEPEEQDEDASE